MAGFDWAVLAVAGISILIGLWRGVVSEVLSLVSWLAAFVGASSFSGALVPYLIPMFGEKGVANVAAFVLFFVGVLLAFALVRALSKRALQAVGLGPLDRLLGGLFGVARAAVILVVLVMAGGMTGLPRQAWWSEASLAPPLETAVLAVKPQLPEMLAKRIRFR